MKFRLPPCCLAFILGLSILPATAKADTTIFASGWETTPGTGAQDSHWQVVALPKDPNSLPNTTTPFQAYVPGNVPGVWMGGSNNDGDGNGAHWITLRPDGALGPWSWQEGWRPYTWVAAQTFNIEVAGVYQFDFYGAGDDYMNFFIDGTISYSTINTPLIVGGTQIGGDSVNFSQLTHFTGSVSLDAGVHTAYMVLHDSQGETGALIGTSTFHAVPEPTSIFLLAIALVGMALHQSRWKSA